MFKINFVNFEHISHLILLFLLLTLSRWMPAGYGFIPGAQIMYIRKILTQKRTIKRKNTQKNLGKGKHPLPYFTKPSLYMRQIWSSFLGQLEKINHTLSGLYPCRKWNRSTGMGTQKSVPEKPKWLIS